MGRRSVIPVPVTPAVLAILTAPLGGNFRASDLNLISALPGPVLQQVVTSLPAGIAFEICQADAHLRQLMSTPTAADAQFRSMMQSRFRPPSRYSTLPYAFDGVSRQTLARLAHNRAAVMVAAADEMWAPLEALLRRQLNLQTQHPTLKRRQRGDRTTARDNNSIHSIGEIVPDAWECPAYLAALRRCAHIVDVVDMQSKSFGRTHQQQAGAVARIVTAHESALPDLLTPQAAACDCQADMVAKTLPRLLSDIRVCEPISCGRIPHLTVDFIRSAGMDASNIIPLITVPRGHTLPVVCGGNVIQLPLPSIQVSVYHHDGRSTVKVHRPRPQWHEDVQESFIGCGSKCLEMGDCQTYATRQVLDVFPFMYLLQTQPADLRRALPSGTRVLPCVSDAIAAHGVADCAGAGGGVAEDPGDAGDEASFLEECRVLAQMGEDDLSMAALRQAILLANVFSDDDLKLLQRLVQLSSNIDSAPGSAVERDAFILAAGRCLPSPFPLLRILGLAHFVHHQRGIDRGIVLLVSALEGVDAVQVAVWWRDAGV